MTARIGFTGVCRAAFAEYTGGSASTTRVGAPVEAEETAEGISIPRDDPVPPFDCPPDRGKPRGDGEWSKDGDQSRDANDRLTAAMPAARVVANVHPVTQDVLRRRVPQLGRRPLQREQPQDVMPVEAVESRRAPGAEAAVRVVQHDEPSGGVASRHGQARTIICARSGPTLTWLIGTPAMASRRST